MRRGGGLAPAYEAVSIVARRQRMSCYKPPPRRDRVRKSSIKHINVSYEMSRITSRHAARENTLIVMLGVIAWHAAYLYIAER